MSSLVDACREGNAAVRPLALKALRGLVGDLDVAELAVKARVVEGLGDLLAGVYAASLDLEDGIAIKVYGRLLDEVRNAGKCLTRAVNKTRISCCPPVLRTPMFSG